MSLTASTYATPTTSSPVRRAIITIETDDIRFRTDGTAPTSSEGHKARPDDIIVLDSRTDIEKFQAIRVTSDATIKVSYKN
jgi:hypothetical protein